MPKIIFGRDNRIIGGMFYDGTIKWDYGTIDLEEIYHTAEKYDEYPFDEIEEWYIAGIQDPEIVSINSDMADNKNNWKYEMNQNYARRRTHGYKMYTKSEVSKDY